MICVPISSHVARLFKFLLVLERLATLAKPDGNAR